MRFHNLYQLYYVNLTFWFFRLFPETSEAPRFLLFSAGSSEFYRAPSRRLVNPCQMLIPVFIVIFFVQLSHINQLPCEESGLLACQVYYMICYQQLYLTLFFSFSQPLLFSLLSSRMKDNKQLFIHLLSR